MIKKNYKATKQVLMCFLFFSIFAAGCAKKLPVPGIDVTRMEAEREITFAEAEIEEARNAGIDVSEAEKLLTAAHTFFAKQDFANAKKRAAEARELVRQLKEQTLLNVRLKEEAAYAIGRAEKLISEAKVSGADTSEAEKLLAAAIDHNKKEEYPAAIDFADRASALARGLIIASRHTVYKVGTWAKDKDCLWNIAAKKDIYNDPWKWKKIFIANRDKIIKPDIIHPGQEIIIPLD